MQAVTTQKSKRSTFKVPTFDKESPEKNKRKRDSERSFPKTGAKKECLGLWFDQPRTFDENKSTFTKRGGGDGYLLSLHRPSRCYLIQGKDSKLPNGKKQRKIQVKNEEGGL